MLLLIELSRSADNSYLRRGQSYLLDLREGCGSQGSMHRRTVQRPCDMAVFTTAGYIRRDRLTLWRDLPKIPGGGAIALHARKAFLKGCAGVIIG